MRTSRLPIFLGAMVVMAGASFTIQEPLAQARSGGISSTTDGPADTSCPTTGTNSTTGTSSTTGTTTGASSSEART